MKRIFTLLIIALFYYSADAQLTLGKEDFIYSAGSITTASSNWTTLSGTANQLSVTSNGLTYGGYNGALSASGNNKISLVSGNSEDANMLFASATTGTVYVSFLLNVTATTGLVANSGAGDYFAGISPNPGSTSFTGRIFIRQGSTSGYQIGVKFNSNAANVTTWATGSGDNMALNTTYLVVLRYTFNSVTTTDDAVDLWINPALGSAPPTPLVSVTNNTATTPTLDLTAVGAFFLRQGNNTPSADIDGIQVGTTWSTSPLPVSLKSFNASLINNKVALNWNTTNEINVDGFSIEKSNDGRTFSNIGFVAARNAASANYSFNDVLAAGVNYYRLKITDKDGSFKYSSIVAVNAKQSTKLDIFPNPVVNTATLSHTKAGDNATVKLITIDGKTVLTQNIQAGATQSSIDVSKLIKGNYLVVFENDGNRTSLQFVKQ